MDLSPFLDELELHGLLLLHAAQELLEVLALLRDVAVLHLLLLGAVAADELRPLFSVLCGDVLHLGVNALKCALKTLVADLRLLIAQECWADEEEAASRFLHYLGFVVSNQCLDFVLRFLL